jgi:putative restriction endonuclease
MTSIALTLAQLSREGPNSIAFRDVEPSWRICSRSLVRPGKSYHPGYPFWRLQNDGLWIVDNADQLQPRTGPTDIPKRELLDKDVHGHFTDEIADRLQRERYSPRMRCR